ARLYQQAMAEGGLRSGADRNLMWKWKTGRRTPTQESQRYLADALSVPRNVIAEEGWPHWLRYAIGGWGSVLEPPWSLAGTMQVLREMAGGPMDRRGFGIITAGTLTVLVRNWGDAVAGSLSVPGLADSAQDRLNPDLLDRLADRLADLRQLDDALGGAELRGLAVAEFRWLVHLAEHAVYDPDSGRWLFRLLAEAARLCGWLHFEAGHQATAQAYYVAALRCSAIANDSLTGANVLACMSFQAALINHHHDAVSLIDGAQQRVRRNATPRLLALLASRKVRAYAKAGDVMACGRALRDAERSLEAATTDAIEPDWLYYFDDAELAAQAPNYVRDRAIYHVRSAETYLYGKELEPACQELHIAVDLVHQSGSVRALETIRTARLSMSPYDHETLVQELDDQLHDLGAQIQSL
ncbi:MAG: hypothetical protein LC808_40205, partial [Actinobacteria bacterium]|nr:hypothetical protein [Actinomycetota bacterium]